MFSSGSVTTYKLVKVLWSDIILKLVFMIIIQTVWSLYICMYDFTTQKK